MGAGRAAGAGFTPGVGVGHGREVRRRADIAGLSGVGGVATEPGGGVTKARSRGQGPGAYFCNVQASPGARARCCLHPLGSRAGVQTPALSAT